MAITKRPTAAAVATAPLDDHERERREQAFLAGAADNGKQAKADDSRMQTVHLRFESDMLPRIDAAMKEMGLTSRASWVRYAVMQTLKEQQK